MAGEEGESGIFQKEKDRRLQTRRRFQTVFPLEGEGYRLFFLWREKVSDCFSSGGRRLQIVFPLEGEGFRGLFL